MQKNWREIVAEKIVATAMDKAKRNVGKSWPTTIYEVEVPEELKAEYHNEKAQSFNWSLVQADLEAVGRDISYCPLWFGGHDRSDCQDGHFINGRSNFSLFTYNYIDDDSVRCIPAIGRRLPQQYTHGMSGSNVCGMFQPGNMFPIGYLCSTAVVDPHAGICNLSVL